MVNLKLANHRF